MALTAMPRWWWRQGSALPTGRKPHLKPMPRHIQRSNAGKSVIRSRVEHVFADQKSQMGLFVRTVGITRATMRIGLANIVYNMRRFLFLERLNATA